MHHATPATEAYTAPELLDALAAVREAIDLPHAATIGDDEHRGRLLADRCMHAALFLDGLLSERPTLGVEWSTAYLREKLAKLPVNYTTWEERGQS